MAVCSTHKTPTWSAAAIAVILLYTAAICPARAADDSCTNPSSTTYFAGIPHIHYEGPDSRNPLAFRYYNRDEVIYGKPMHEWLRFSLAFWHTMRGDGGDMFGSATRVWPWEDASLGPVEQAKVRLDAFFELLDKLGVDYWCFHDRDIAPEGNTLAETNSMLDDIAEHALQLQKQYNKQVLWGTAQLFKHPRYMHGAATSPNATVFAYAAAQVKKAMDVSKRLGAKAYVLWGGREGYHTLRNTDLRRELDNLATFMKLVAAYNKKSGFRAQLLLEPKPQEPTKHQYDYDAATTMAFLHTYGLTNDFKLNIECNHATLAGHSCEHEVAMASAFGFFGSLDANTGDPQTGWDTDQFLTDTTEATLLMRVLLKQGGLAPSGINFDAKLRRESTDPVDLVLAHIGGMDALARGLRNAAAMLEEGSVEGAIRARYASYEDSALGQAISKGKTSLEALEGMALEQQRDPVEDVASGRAELFETMLNWFVV